MRAWTTCILLLLQPALSIRLTQIAHRTPVTAMKRRELLSCAGAAVTLAVLPSSQASAADGKPKVVVFGGSGCS